MIPSQVYCRLARFTGESGRSGSAFFADGPDGLALVTAAHNCSGDREEYVHFQQAWAGLQPMGALLDRKEPVDGGPDLAVFQVPENLRPDWYIGTVMPNDDGVIYGQDCYILGYPYLLSGDAAPVPGSELPLIKKCIISGKLTTGGVTSWYVDTIANPGFSGGPLVFRVGETSEYRFAGVVTKAMSGPLIEGGPASGPAGFSTCVAAGHMRALMGFADSPTETV